MKRYFHLLRLSNAWAIQREDILWIAIRILKFQTAMNSNSNQKQANRSPKFQFHETVKLSIPTPEIPKQSRNRVLKSKKTNKSNSIRVNNRSVGSTPPLPTPQSAKSVLNSVLSSKLINQLFYLINSGWGLNSSALFWQTLTKLN